LSAAILLLVCGLAIASCAPFAGFVSDHWPTWAGGMPNDVPPRPGAPGYEEFLAHQAGRDAAPPAGSGASAAQPAATAGPAAEGTNSQPVPGNSRPDDRAAVQGGLY
jgi:hypothetical protein